MNAFLLSFCKYGQQKKKWKRLLFLCFSCFLVTQSVGQTPVTTVPYYCGFEDPIENQEWILNPGNSAIINHVNFKNKWTIGNGAKKSGYSGLYIYTDNDPSAAKYAEAAMYTLAYREFSLPAGNYDLAFSWRALGEQNADEIIAYWAPSSVATNSSLNSTAPALLNAYKLTYSDGTSAGLSGAASWRYASSSVRVTGNTTYKLVFLWRNNNSNTYNPGACIDNIQLQARPATGECGFVPTNIQADDETIGTVTVTWDGYAGVTYDLIYWMDATGVQDTVFGLNTTSFTLNTEDMATGMYTFWVRTVCPDGTTSIWGEVSDVRIIGENVDMAASACPEVSFFANEIDEHGVKKIIPECNGASYTIVPKIVGGGGSIVGYRVDQIAYNPPFPFDMGTPIFVNQDDVWGDVIQLPFSFCFFENVYQQAVVGANGIISFDTQVANQASGYVLRDEPDIPSPDFVDGDGGHFWRNAIYGVCEDIDPNKITTNNTGGGIYYGLLGEYPCRTLTVSWHKVPNFSCTSDWNTYQIVLYEGTSIIDVYVEQRLACPSWNDGIGIIGLQNAEGTDGIAAPGRNTTSPTWEAQQEAWRFTPLTTPVYEMTWYKGAGFDGQVLGKGDSLQINQEDGIDTVTVRMQFSACNGEYFDLADTAIVAWQVTDTLPMKNVYVCEGDVYSDEYFTGITEPGEYEYPIKNQLDCDSVIYRVKVDFLEAETFVLDTTICYGDTLEFKGSKYSRTGVYTKNYQYVSGCDSLIDSIKLTVLPRINYVASKTDAMTGPNSGSIEITMQEDDYYYTLNGEMNAPTDALAPGTYELIVYNSYDCATEPEIIEIVTECLEAELIEPIEAVCADQEALNIEVQRYGGGYAEYSILFSEEAKNGGFADFDHLASDLSADGMDAFVVELPDKVLPGSYTAELVLHDINCGDKKYPFSYEVLYPDSVIVQRWDDMLSVTNDRWNGGYTFSAYQWYKDGSPMEGQTHSYLYVPEEKLDINAEYAVLLTRVDDNVTVMTCPFTPVEISEEEKDKLVISLNNMTYNGQVVEVVVNEPVQIKVYNAMGVKVMEEYVEERAEICLPKMEGLYILEVTNSEGKRETYRVIVK